MVLVCICVSIVITTVSLTLVQLSLQIFTYWNDGRFCCFWLLDHPGNNVYLCINVIVSCICV